MVGIEIDARPLLYNRFVRFGEPTQFALINLNADGSANNEVLTDVQIKIYSYGKELIDSPLLSFNFSSGISQTGNEITCDLDITTLEINDYDWSIHYIRLSGSTCVAQGTLNISANARNFDPENINYLLVQSTGPKGDPGTGGSAGIPTGGNAGDILAKIDGTDYNTEWIENFTSKIEHDVKLGEAINKGQAAYVSSANGTNIIVSKASNTTESTSSKTLGIIKTTGILNDIVRLITEGLIQGINTDAGNAGDPIWLGESGNLIFGLANKPIAPKHLVFVGILTRKHAVNGEIFVKIQNGFELNEIHDVLIETKTNRQGLVYDSVSGLWKNKFSFFDLLSGGTMTTTTAITGGTVYTYLYSGSINRYRYVSTGIDSFYSTFSGGVLSNLIIERYF